MATTRSSTAALCSATAEAASYGRSKLKEEKEEVTELTEQLKVARRSFVAQWRRRIDDGELRWLKMRTKGETALPRLRAPAEATGRRSRPLWSLPKWSTGAAPGVAATTTKDGGVRARAWMGNRGRGSERGTCGERERQREREQVGEMGGGRGVGAALSSPASSTRWCGADRGRERPVAAESEEQEGGGGNRCRELGRGALGGLARVEGWAEAQGEARGLWPFPLSFLFAFSFSFLYSFSQ